MSIGPDRRSRKRLATRQCISDVATRLFFERGFDNVTVDEIAAAADVGRMTVFNHFPRKEDLFFDRDQEGRDLLLDAVRQRDPDVAPVEALRRLAHQLIGGQHRLINFSEMSHAFLKTVAESETLKARARAIRDELADSMASTLAAAVGRDSGDDHARLAAALLLASWTVAFLQAHRCFHETQDPDAARRTFLSLIDLGAAGQAAAMAGTPYA